MKPQLIIDSNERGLLCESVERKATKAGLTVARQALVVGDYQLGGACVEPSIGDLFQSSHRWTPVATTGQHGCQLRAFLPCCARRHRKVNRHGEKEWAFKNLIL